VSFTSVSCAQINSAGSPHIQDPVAQSKIVLIPNTVDFSNVVLGQKNTQTVKLSNEDKNTVQVKSIRVAGSAFSITGLTFPFSLAPQDSRTFNVEFAPKAAGPDSGTLTVESNLAEPAVVSVKGVGTKAEPKLQVKPASVNFGNLGVAGTAAQTVVITNNGNSNVTVSQVITSGAGFTLAELPTHFTLAPQQETTFLVSFHPQAKGAASGSIKFVSKDLPAPLTMPLTGAGVDGTPKPQGSTHTVALTWDASTSKVKGYYVYRGDISGGPYTRLTDSATANLGYTDANVESGQRYFYVVTSVDGNGQESLYSQQISVTIPNP
jgi:hypothetical protein